ncbi:matE family protein, partial [Vibrio parahaemolyticus EKP-028]
QLFFSSKLCAASLMVCH